MGEEALGESFLQRPTNWDLSPQLLKNKEEKGKFGMLSSSAIGIR